MCYACSPFFTVHYNFHWWQKIKIKNHSSVCYARLPFFTINYTLHRCLCECDWFHFHYQTCEHPWYFILRRRHCQHQALSVSFIHDSCQFWYNTVSFRKHTNNISYGFIVITSNPSLFSSFSEDPSFHGLQAVHERRVVPGNRIVWWAED